MIIREAEEVSGSTFSNPIISLDADSESIVITDDTRISEVMDLTQLANCCINGRPTMRHVPR